MTAVVPRKLFLLLALLVESDAQVPSQTEVCSDGSVNCEWKNGGKMLEYTANANPYMSEVPVKIFPSSLHKKGKTHLKNLDLKDSLGLSYPATAPNLLASFLEVPKTSSSIVLNIFFDFSLFVHR